MLPYRRDELVDYYCIRLERLRDWARDSMRETTHMPVKKLLQRARTLDGILTQVGINWEEEEKLLSKLGLNKNERPK